MEESLVSHLDVIPTFFAIAGLPLPSDRLFDGVDISALLFTDEAKAGVSRREKGIEEVRTLIHQDNAGRIGAVRWGDFKVFFSTCAAASCGEVYYECGHKRTNVTLVFDIAKDPEESRPLDPGERRDQAIGAALAHVAEFEASLDSGLRTLVDFSHGSKPDNWVCCTPSELSCRCSDKDGEAASQSELSCNPPSLWTVLGGLIGR